MNYKEKERKRKGESIVLAVLNQKGGVGKSTTAINLAAALGDKGQKILLIDLDPQGNTTSGLGVDKSNLDACIYDALINDASADDLIIKTCADNVYLIPATIQLTGAELELVSAVARESRLKDVIDSVREYFDFVLIDCPRRLGY